MREIAVVASRYHGAFLLYCQRMQEIVKSYLQVKQYIIPKLEGLHNPKYYVQELAIVEIIFRWLFVNLK
eukprot:snap_masked-scaffold_11-processed-gene-8.19-mRNA-1 protein AED:1.00 eAED:1.00 QI:0/0/0/0/1/1/2/0/68